MQLVDYFQTYIHYLIHPFKTHDVLSGRQLETSFKLSPISLSEAIGASWALIVINGMIRIFLVNFVIFAFLRITDTGAGIFSIFGNQDSFVGFYFLILTTILDVIFFPLFTLFLVQFWELVIKMFGKLLKVDGDLDEKARTIMTVALSSHLLVVLPIVGAMAQKFAAMILMYAGLRKQLNASVSLSLCILFFPILLMLFFFSLIMLIIVMRLI